MPCSLACDPLSADLPAFCCPDRCHVLRLKRPDWFRKHEKSHFSLTGLQGDMIIKFSSTYMIDSWNGIFSLTRVTLVELEELKGRTNDWMKQILDYFYQNCGWSENVKSDVCNAFLKIALIRRLKGSVLASVDRSDALFGLTFSACIMVPWSDFIERTLKSTMKTTIQKSKGQVNMMSQRAVAGISSFSSQMVQFHSSGEGSFLLKTSISFINVSNLKISILFRMRGNEFSTALEN